MIAIGNSKIDTNVFLAPLSGCSDLAFRLIAREHGAGFCFFEMIDAHTLKRSRPRTLKILHTNKDDSPIAAQLLGENPDIMVDAAKKLTDFVKISFLDINCACPVKKVVKKKAGAYLLKTPEVIAEMVSKVSRAVPVPVTVKMRIGFERKDTKRAIDTAKMCEDSGCAALFVHGRTAKENYHIAVDYPAIKAIKDSVNIPVFGMGNIMSADLAKKMFDETGCDGITVARGAFGNPWIFREIDDLLTGRHRNTSIGLDEKKKTMARHISYIETHKDIMQRGKIGFMRKAVLWYIKGFPLAKRIREKIVLAKTYESILSMIEEIR